MELRTSDGKRTVDIGSEDIWFSVYSTAEERLGGFKRKIPLALEFLKTKECTAENAQETARQINLMRDEFASIKPEKAVYDMNDKKVKAPWYGKISPVVTSCANLYTTADGGDLLFEVVGILTYASIKKKDVTD